MIPENFGVDAIALKCAVVMSFGLEYSQRIPNDNAEKFLTFLGAEIEPQAVVVTLKGDLRLCLHLCFSAKIIGGREMQTIKRPSA